MSCNFPVLAKMCAGWESKPEPLALTANVLPFELTGR